MRKVQCAKPVVTFAFNSLPTIPWWLQCDRLPWLPDIEGTSLSICAAAIASTHPALTLPLFLWLLSITSSPCNTNAIHSEKRGEGQGRQLFESFSSRRTELSWQMRERASNKQQGLSKIHNKWKGTGSPTICELCPVNFSLCCLAFLLCVAVDYYVSKCSTGFKAFRPILHILYCNNYC